MNTMETSARTLGYVYGGIPAPHHTCAWLKTVVMLKHPGHFTSMKKLSGYTNNDREKRIGREAAVRGDTICEVKL